jgi:hypothetical protein
MARFSIGFLLFILAYCVTYSSAAVATLWQQEFEMKIEAKINQLIKAKNVQLEEKVTQLEAQLELNVSTVFSIFYSHLKLNYNINFYLIEFHLIDSFM